MQEKCKKNYNFVQIVKKTLILYKMFIFSTNMEMRYSVSGIGH